MSKHLLSGKWTQPGGHVELDESPWSAVKHEILEESGYSARQLKALQPQVRLKELGSDAVLVPMPACLMSYELDTKKEHFHTDIIFAFVADREPEEEILEGESMEVEYFSRSELLALSPEEVPDNVRRVSLFVLDGCLSSWEAVSVS